MGENVQHSHFSEEDHQKFSRKLKENLDLLELLLSTPGFGKGSTSLGAELELDVIDSSGQTRWINDKLVNFAKDPQLTFEVNQYNVEYNLSPVPAAGRPFTRIGREISSKFKQLNTLAKKYDARAIMIGILPTLEERDIGQQATTECNRYYVLAEELEKLRSKPNRVEINGLDKLVINNAKLSAEGANTSFQLHLRTNPDEFSDVFNAAQLASAPALAISTNSPFFLQRRLWEETRIPLFKQLIEIHDSSQADTNGRASMGSDWVKEGVFELFRKSVEKYPVLIPECTDKNIKTTRISRLKSAPELAELRLHHGSIWHWNRAIYDPHGSGHIRIELRALPSGPSVIDMMANAAFLLGLTKGLQKRMTKIPGYMPFKQMNSNFYQAAQFGLDATFDWPKASGRSLQRITAASLIEELIPVAEDGLQQLQVKQDEIDNLLACIKGRVEKKMTGARWQLAIVKQLESKMSRKEALQKMISLYLELSDSNKPVHQWPLTC